MSSAGSATPPSTAIPINTKRELYTPKALRALVADLRECRYDATSKYTHVAAFTYICCRLKVGSVPFRGTPHLAKVDGFLPTSSTPPTAQSVCCYVLRYSALHFRWKSKDDAIIAILFRGSHTLSVQRCPIIGLLRLSYPSRPKLKLWLHSASFSRTSTTFGHARRLERTCLCTREDCEKLAVGRGHEAHRRQKAGSGQLGTY